MTIEIRKENNKATVYIEHNEGSAKKDYINMKDLYYDMIQMLPVLLKWKE